MTGGRCAARDASGQSEGPPPRGGGAVRTASGEVDLAIRKRDRFEAQFEIRLSRPTSRGPDLAGREVCPFEHTRKLEHAIVRSDRHFAANLIGGECSAEVLEAR